MDLDPPWLDGAVLITGAAGSVGSELVRQVLSSGAARVVALDHDENALCRLSRIYPDGRLGCVLGSIRDGSKLRRVFDDERPSLVLHAAAHKHLPILEDWWDEAIQNNVGGTLNVAVMAAEFGVGTLVHTSTDKAADPSSILGATKLVAEGVVRAFAGGDGRARRFVSVRFGNVLGSVGSVTTVFAEQLRAGGPLTVTHPDMYRYLMTPEAAARLVLRAARRGSPGAVAAGDMGAPVSIRALAESMIRDAGRDGDVEIVFTGPRSGEKLEEVIFSDAELAEASIRIVDGFTEVVPPPVPHRFLEGVEALIGAARDGDRAAVDAILPELVRGASGTAAGAPVRAVLGRVGP